MPSVFTVSNFQRADTAKSDHKANASRQRGKTEVEMSGGASLNFPLLQHYPGNPAITGKNMINTTWSSFTFFPPLSLTNGALFPTLLFLWLTHAKSKGECLSHFKC